MFFSSGLCVQLLSRVQPSAPPWTVARQAPLSMGFPRQGHWRPNPGIKPSLAPSALADRFFSTVPPGARPFPTHKNDFPLWENEKCRKRLDHRWKPRAAWKSTIDKTDINKNRDIKNELCIFIQKPDGLHDKYSLCLKHQKFFSWKMIFSLLVLECTYLTSPHQFWTWTAQCHLKGCRIMVSPGVIQKSCGHTDWWSLVAAPSTCLAQFLRHWCPWSWHSETASRSQPPWEIAILQVLWLSTFQKTSEKISCHLTQQLKSELHRLTDFFQAFTYMPL